MPDNAGHMKTLILCSFVYKHRRNTSYYLGHKCCVLVPALSFTSYGDLDNLLTFFIFYFSHLLIQHHWDNKRINTDSVR